MTVRQRPVKVAFVGAVSVGKSSIIRRIVCNEFMDQEPTVNAALYKFHVDERVTLSIWDTAGQDRFDSITPLYYRGARFICLTLAVNDMTSFDKCKFWLNEIQVNADVGTRIFCVANKIDLGFNQLNQETLTTFSHANQLDLLFVSAKTGEGIDNLIQTLQRCAHEPFENQQVPLKDVIQVKTHNHKCC